MSNEEYPGQAYFHRMNPDIKRAEEARMKKGHLFIYQKMTSSYSRYDYKLVKFVPFRGIRPANTAIGDVTSLADLHTVISNGHAVIILPEGEHVQS